MHVHAYLFQTINTRKQQLLLYGAFEITQRLGIYDVKKKFYETEL